MTSDTVEKRGKEAFKKNQDRNKVSLADLPVELHTKIAAHLIQECCSFDSSGYVDVLRLCELSIYWTDVVLAAIELHLRDLDSFIAPTAAPVADDPDMADDPTWATWVYKTCSYGLKGSLEEFQQALQSTQKSRALKKF